MLWPYGVMLGNVFVLYLSLCNQKLTLPQGDWSILATNENLKAAFKVCE